MDAGEGRGELLGKRGARRRVLGVAQETAGERLPIDVVHHEEWRAEHGGVVLAPAHARHRHAGGRRRLEQQELVAAARLDDVARRVAAKDEALGPAVGRRQREQPGLARGTAGQAAEPADARLGAELTPEVGRERGGEVSQGDRGIRTSRSRPAHPSATR